MLRASTDNKIKILLKDSMGAPVPGLVTADFSASNIFLYKPDNTKVTITLSGANFAEVDATDAPGIYSFLLLAANLDQAGQYTVQINPAAAAFTSVTYFDDCSPLEANVTSTVALLPGTTIASAVNVTSAITSIKGVDSRDLSTIAGTGFSPSDSLNAIKAAVSTLPSDAWDETLSGHNTSATFGELLNLLNAILFQRIKIDKVAKTLELFAPDNTTVLKTYSLYDINGMPAYQNITERSKAT